MSLRRRALTLEIQTGSPRCCWSKFEFNGFYYYYPLRKDLRKKIGCCLGGRACLASFGRPSWKVGCQEIRGVSAAFALVQGWASGGIKRTRSCVCVCLFAPEAAAGGRMGKMFWRVGTGRMRNSRVLLVAMLLAGFAVVKLQAADYASQEARQTLKFGVEGTELEGDGEHEGLEGGEVGDSSSRLEAEQSVGGKWGEAVSARSPQGQGRQRTSAVAHYKPSVPSILSEYVARSGLMLSRLIVTVVARGGIFAGWVREVMSRAKEDGVDWGKQVREGSHLGPSHKGAAQ